MIEDIGVAYVLVGVSSSPVVVVDMAGVGKSNDIGRNCGSGIGELEILGNRCRATFQGSKQRIKSK